MGRWMDGRMDEWVGGMTAVLALLFCYYGSSSCCNSSGVVSKAVSL